MTARKYNLRFIFLCELHAACSSPVSFSWIPLLRPTPPPLVRERMGVMGYPGWLGPGRDRFGLALVCASSGRTFVLSMIDCSYNTKNKQKTNVHVTTCVGRCRVSSALPHILFLK